ncbi:MAG: putative NAD/FAD-binding protein [Methylophilaceae bacterium]|jgi:predicted NAD/FAD-binding protein|tara:strand:+ start:10253 stop:11500 length:1248 start_codon:yes stop_codon:yes gene_type:complete
MRIAVIGTGVSGLGAAYLLHQHHDLVIYEKNDYLGGHSRTIDVPVKEGVLAVDTGFIVFNDWNYPNLLGLFDEIRVPYQKSDMSFGVSIDDGWLEYSSGGLFAQRKNILRPQYWRMLFDVFKFNKQALAYIEKDPSITLGNCLEQLKMGSWFKRYYILAMGAAIWSCPVETIMQFPAQTFLRFFKNHGLLSINKRPQWYTVTGGSREYIKRLTAPFADCITLGNGAARVTQLGDQYVVIDVKGGKREFDHVIFACHADQALALLEKPTVDEQSVLSSFDYQRNHIVVHSDASYMPQHKQCWASWVYLSEQQQDNNQDISLSYWMNNLQSLKTETPVIITLNPTRRPKESLIINEHNFSHPIFDYKAIIAQDKMQSIQGQRNLWFCGAYQRYGFHEDGLLSAVNVVKRLGGTIPWE